MRRRRILRLIALAAALPAVGLPRAATAEEPKKKAGGETYVPFNTLTGTTNKPGGRRGVLTVECGLDVPDPKLRERATLSLPRLQAAYVLSIQSYASGLPPGEPPNIELIGKTLQRQTDLVLGKPGAKLLLGAVLVN